MTDRNQPSRCTYCGAKAWACRSRCQAVAACLYCRYGPDGATDHNPTCPYRTYPESVIAEFDLGSTIGQE